MTTLTRTNKLTAPTRDTHTNWAANDPIIPEGVLAVVKGRLYTGSIEYMIGDGVTAYSSLKKFGSELATLAEVIAGTETGKAVTPSTLAGLKNIKNGIVGIGSDGKILSSLLKDEIIAQIPCGTLISVLGEQASVPVGYLLANGAAVSRTVYSELYAVIGTAYGVGDGSTTFNLPNPKDCFLAFSGDYLGVNMIGEEGIPNITGSISSLLSAAYTIHSGAIELDLYGTTPPKLGTLGTESGASFTLNLDASKAASVYKDSSAHVLPKHIVVRPYIKY